MNPARALWPALAALLFVNTPALSQTVVAHADFDQDTLEESPSTDPAGPPDGDSIVLYQSGGPITVESSYGPLDTKPAVLVRQTTGSFGLQLFVDPDFRDCLNYTVTWKEVVDAEVGFIYVNMFSPNSLVVASFEFRQDYVLSLNGSGHPLVATYGPNELHEYSVHIDLQTDTVDAWVDGIADPNGQDIRTNQVGGNGLKGIAFAYGLVDPSVIAIDDVHITASNCGGVATEPTSWSEVKSHFR